MWRTCVDRNNFGGHYSVNIAYIKWKDAVAEEADGPLGVERLAVLEEVGFFAGETEDSVTIAMEKEEVHGAVCPGRWRLSIPKSAIIELRMVEMGRAFGIKKERRQRGGVPKVKRVDNPRVGDSPVSGSEA